MHQVVSISTKLHQSAQSAIKLYQVASANLQQVAPNSTKLHQSAVEDYETSFRLLLNYILLNLLCYRILHTFRLSGILSFFWSH